MTSKASTTETTSTDSDTSEPAPEARRLRLDLWDVMLLAGILLLSAGGALAWLPLGLLIPGAALTAWGTMGNVKLAREHARRRRREEEERRGPVR